MSARVKSHRKNRTPTTSRPPKTNKKPPPAPQRSPSNGQATADIAIGQSRGTRTPVGLKPADILALQATMGNAAVQRMIKAQRARGQEKGASQNSPARTNGRIHTPPVTHRPDDSGLIQRALEGDALVIEKTHLRKPNKAGTAPRKLPAIFNQVGKAIKKNTIIKLLAEEVTVGKNVQWQKAKHPDTGKQGFVRMSKVVASGPTPPSEIDTPSGPSQVESIAELTKVLTGIVSDGSKIGANVGTMLSAKSKTEKDLAQVMLNQPEFANKWFQFGKNPNKTKAEDMVKDKLEGYTDVLNTEWQLGFKTGGLAAGAVGDFGGAIGGFLGMIKGVQKFHKSKGKVSDTIDYAVAETSSGAGMMASGSGALSKISGLVSGFTEKGSTAKTIFTTLQGTFGFIGSGIKTVKGSVDTVVKIVKAIQGSLKKKGKSAKEKFQTFIETTADIAGSALGTVKSAIMTVAGFLKTLKSLPLVSSILGIVGSVIDLVTGALNLIKSIYDSVKLILKIKKDHQLIEDLKQDDSDFYEAVLTRRLLAMEQAALPEGESVSEDDLAKDEDGLPTVKQQEMTLNKYRRSGEGDSTADYYADEVETHLADQTLIGTVRKRINKARLNLAGAIVDGVASGLSIFFGLISIGADIAAVASSPTGVGPAAALATKTISSTVSTVLTGGIKLGKGLFTLGRMGVRKIKQFARDKGWANTNQDKTSEKKMEKRKNVVKSLMMGLYDLVPDFSSFEDDAKRAQLRIEATGVDTKDLYEKNGEPLEQAKILMKALGNTG